MSVVNVGTTSDSISLTWMLPGELPSRPSIRLHPQEVPGWLPPVLDRLTDLGSLPTVDPRGSRPMVVEDVLMALNFMDRNMRDDTMAPWIGRLNSGGIQLTWRCGDVEVEAVFDSARDDYDVIVTVADNEWDAPVRDADSLFATVVDRLSSQHLEYIANA